MQNNLYIIAGCNGAGKTTASFNILPDLLACREFVNADAIAAALSPFQPESVAFDAGRIMLKRIDELLEKQVDFAIETTLATKSYKNLIEKAQAKNYKVTLLFFWLSSSDMAVERVKSRVEKGGHHIPTEVIHRRYERGIKNLFEIYLDICDKVLIFDNTKRKRRLIAQQKDDLEIEILLPKKLKAMKKVFSEPKVPYFDAFTIKILDAMDVHYQKLVEKTIAENSYLVVTNEKDEIVRVYADELKRQLDAGLLD
jgi:predicted ABC-type ATPase